MHPDDLFRPELHKVLIVMTYDKALEILNEYGEESVWIQHCLAVSNMAEHLSEALTPKLEINIEFLRCASLLHDIGRYSSHDPIMHGVEGYNLLSALGYSEEAFVCASHILYGLSRNEAAQFGLPAIDFEPKSIEEKLVPLIDFMVEFDQPTTLDRRFASLRERNSKNVFFMKKLKEAEKTAKCFMFQLSEKVGESIEEIALSF